MRLGRSLARLRLPVHTQLQVQLQLQLHWRRQFSVTSANNINPLMPIDPTDLIGKEEEDKEEAQKKEQKRKEKEERDKYIYKTPIERENEEKQDKREENWNKIKGIFLRSFETGIITFTSLLILGSSGIMYHKIYKKDVLDKISSSFDEGDITLQLQKHKISTIDNENKYWVEREQQQLLDEIVKGQIQGRYFLIIGEKGTGKTSAIMESIRRVNGKDCAIVDCSSDLELFRLRVGAALNFEFHEDYIGSLFSMRGPRDTTALLDIERAFTKLEEVALKRVKKTKKPLILVFNNAHLIQDDEQGKKLVELLQQKAESFSGSSLVTMIFNSDDYWLYEKFKKLGTRLEVLNFKDLTRMEAINALKVARLKFFNTDISDEECSQIYDLIGGRPQHINHVAAHWNTIKSCHDIIDKEKIWFLNQCGLLGEEMDDDVMDQGKFAASAMLLMRELVEMDRNRLKALVEKTGKDGKVDSDSWREHELPELPLWRARQVMTRPDFIQSYDNLNIFTIDSYSKVRADSVPMMRAFHEIASQPDFDQLLAETITRVSDIESLGRTRELVMKDLMLGGKYKLEKKLANGAGVEKSKLSMEGGSRDLFITERQNEGFDSDDGTEDSPLLLDEFYEGAHKKWWTKRMKSYKDTYVPAVPVDPGKVEEKQQQLNDGLDLSRVADTKEGGEQIVDV
ncbi:hypothetical protein CANARDRAFT_8408 [[Candida] arabinofermentans NRRL YB-2248]|uniref:ATPase domain-containing protein n=1 Tax=[Candida] arabinofermentans NRRL YB-2248 TaxID=983967 RepID=A0A1E4SZC2_9ASCO|nr:hypothetical protein CANARDRAFT_8408 [[Candida] arabinofermentans NRRL YB-2248]